jgi:Rad3-related DNA helicase
MTEGVDLKDDLSRFQVFLKVPFPYLGDQVTQKRMKLNSSWYAFMTARTIVQGIGRSIRNENDSAVTYILDSCFHQFYRQNKKMFPLSFQQSIK